MNASSRTNLISQKFFTVQAICIQASRTIEDGATSRRTLGSILEDEEEPATDRADLLTGTVAEPLPLTCARGGHRTSALTVSSRTANRTRQYYFSVCKCASTNQRYWSLPRETTVNKSAVPASPNSSAWPMELRTSFPYIANV